jgi:hypothetical protein
MRLHFRPGSQDDGVCVRRRRCPCRPSHISQNELRVVNRQPLPGVAAESHFAKRVRGSEYRALPVWQRSRVSQNESGGSRYRVLPVCAAGSHFAKEAGIDTVADVAAEPHLSSRKPPKAAIRDPWTQVLANSVMLVFHGSRLLAEPVRGRREAPIRGLGRDDSGFATVPTGERP